MELFSNVIKEVGKDTGFGEVVDHGDKKVIPVYRTSFGFGFGFGEKNRIRNGGGMGGHRYGEPLGVYEVSKNSTKFVPVIDIKGIIKYLFLGMAIIGMLINKEKKSYYKNMYKGKYKYMKIKERKKKWNMQLLENLG